MTTPTTLYRLYSPTNALLYIGVGGNPGRRFQQHRGAKHWWGDIAHITLEHHPTREAAFAAETAAILTENPRHNIAGRAAPTIPSKPNASRWQHIPLPNGAYLDIENHGNHTYVGINRDDLTDQLKHNGHAWKLPTPLLDATEQLADLATLWLWADGCQHDTYAHGCGSRFRGINIPPAHAPAAIDALAASELREDPAPLHQFADVLAASFPPVDKFRPHRDYRPNALRLLARHGGAASEQPWAVALQVAVEQIDARWGRAA